MAASQQAASPPPLVAATNSPRPKLDLSQIHSHPLVAHNRRSSSSATSEGADRKNSLTELAAKKQQSRVSSFLPTTPTIVGTKPTPPRDANNNTNNNNNISSSNSSVELRLRELSQLSQPRPMSLQPRSSSRLSVSSSITGASDCSPTWRRNKRYSFNGSTYSPGSLNESYGRECPSPKPNVILGNFSISPYSGTTRKIIWEDERRE